MSNLPEIMPCVKCKGEKKAKVVRIDGLYYVQCPCCKWERYMFLGLKPENAICEWNKFNREMKRVGNKKYEHYNQES